MSKKTKKRATFQGAGDNKVALRARPENGAVDVIVDIGDGKHYGASLDIKTIQKLGVTAIEFGVVAERDTLEKP